MPDIGWYPLQLESLEARPAEEGRVCGDEFAEALDETLVVHAGTGLLRGRDLRRGVLADRLM